VYEFGRFLLKYTLKRQNQSKMLYILRVARLSAKIKIKDHTCCCCCCCCCFLLTRPFFCHLRIFLILYYSSCSYHRYAVSTRWEREVEENGPIRDYNRFFCCCARRLGNMFILWGRSDGSPIVVAGPCWPFCVLVTLVSLLQYNALFSVLQS
jgi:hypothetical protein